MAPYSPITPAVIEWQDKTPYAPAFEDIYFSKDAGVAETEHVFLEGNQLRERWQKQEGRFCIAETGFGTGLNFLTTLKLFEKTASPTARLEYVSLEKHPLSVTDVERTLQAFGFAQSQIQALTDTYPPPVAGLHRRFFLNDRVVLSLYFGEALEILQNLEASVNAWFLDGFTPAKNPDMWSPELFQEMARLSKDSATFATFSAARSVIDGLEKSGFRCEKIPGFKDKKHMLRGRFKGTPSRSQKTPVATTIIGAGIAGATCAHALNRYGAGNITLLEAENSPGTGASSNPAAVLYPKLTAQPTPQCWFYLQAYLHSVALLKSLRPSPDPFSPPGVIHLDHDEKKATQHRKILENLKLPETVMRALTADEIREAHNLNQDKSGVLYPGGGTVDLGMLTRMLIPDSIDLRTNTAAASLSYQDRQWRIETNQDRLESDYVIIANNLSAREFTPIKHLPLEAVAGQLTRVRNIASSAELPTAIINYAGHMVPPNDQGIITLGSTYRRHEELVSVRSEDHLENLAKLKTALPETHKALAVSNPEMSLEGWAGVRGTTPQRFPLFGPVITTDGGPESSLYLSLGHGSHASSSALFAADLIAAQIMGYSYPRDMLEIPARMQTKYLQQVAA